MPKQKRVSKIIEAQRQADLAHDLLTRLPADDPRFDDALAHWRVTLAARAQAEAA